MKLKELINLKYGKNQSKVVADSGYPIYGTGGIIGYASKFLYDKQSILIGRKGSIAQVQFLNEPFWCVDTTFYCEINTNLVIPKYLFYKLSTIDFRLYNEGTTIPSLRSETLNELEISIHSFEIQQHIVDTIGSIDDLIEKYDEILIGIEKLETKLYLFESTDSVVNPLRNFISFEKGKKPDSLDENGHLYLTIDTLERSNTLFTQSSKVVNCIESDVLMVMDGASSGKVYIGNKGVVGSTLSVIKSKDINNYFLYIFLKNNYSNIKDRNTGSAIPHTNKEFVLTLNIPLNKIDDSIYNNLFNYRIVIMKNINRLKALKSAYLSKFFE